MDTNINRHAQLASDTEATPNTPHFDNPQLSELPDKTQSTDCIPKPNLPRTPGLVDFSIGLLTGAALALILKCLSDDDTTTSTDEDD